MKKLITKQDQFDLIKENERGAHQKNSRDETMMEAKIYDTLHNMKINEFSSLLSLKIIDGNRIVEESSNLKLSINQILRWVVDRYF